MGNKGDKAFGRVRGNKCNVNTKRRQTMRPICLDPGHDHLHRGAVYSDVKEEEVVLEVCIHAKKILEYYNIPTVLTRTDEKELDPDKSKCLMARPAMAAAQNCNMFVSVHTNADPDEDAPGMPEAHGEEIWVYPGSVSGKKLAEGLVESIDIIMPDEPFRGVKEANFGVLRGAHEAGMAGCLVELGFIDTSASNRKFADPNSRMLIGMWLAFGLRDYVYKKGGE